MNKIKRQMSIKSKRYIRSLLMRLMGYSVIWAVIFIVIKLVSTDASYGPYGLQNEVAAAISAYCFEVMSGMWVCAVIMTLIYQWKKLVDALQNQEEEAQRKKNEMLTYLAHDLRTPLTSILGYAHILEEMKQLDTEEAREYLRVISTKSELLQEMLNEFFEVTKLETGNVHLNFEPMNLAAMLQQLAMEYTPILQEKGLKLACDVVPQAMVECDAEKMERVFDNLMRNAIKYATEGSEVRVSAAISENHFCITFGNATDEELGETQLEEMFEPFVRLDEARKEVEGTGIGLAIVKEIMELHGGRTSANYQNGRLQICLEFRRL